MRNILIDSSVWIEYFRVSDKTDNLFIDEILDTNLVCTNDLILSELIPFLRMKKQKELIDILGYIRKIPLAIDWKGIIEYQSENLRHGINNVGIPDLIILQNVIDNDLELMSLDRHFKLMQKHSNFKLIQR